LLKRCVLFLSAIPIAVLMNGLRIAVIGATVDRWGVAMAEGVLHDIEGWMVFLGCAVCLLIEIEIFQRIGRKGTFDLEFLRFPKLAYVKLPGAGGPGYACLFIAVIGVLAGLMMSSILPNALKPVPLKASFASFPPQLGPWIGHLRSLDSASLAKLGTGDYLLADYAKPEGEPVNLYALYYPEQDSISNEAIHSPSVCIPSGGWDIESSSTKTIPLDGGGTLTVNRVVVSKELMRQVVYYWFVQDGQAAWEANSAKLYQMRNAITKGRTNGAMIRLMTMISGGESEADADQRLAEFMQASLGTLNGFMFP
jgi:EpsI family protein